MSGSKWALGGTVAAALIAAFASAYSAYASLNATREAATLTAAASIEVEKLRKQNSDRQSDIEMVKLALNILGGEISDKTQESREFAIALLARYSGVQIEPPNGQKWATSGSVSFTSRLLGLSSANSDLGSSLVATEETKRLLGELGFNYELLLKNTPKP